jgi:hypothetical protein
VLCNKSLSNKPLTKYPQKYTIIGLIPQLLAKLSVFAMAHNLTNGGWLLASGFWQLHIKVQTSQSR